MLELTAAAAGNGGGGGGGLAISVEIEELSYAIEVVIWQTVSTKLSLKLSKRRWKWSKGWSKPSIPSRKVFEIKYLHTKRGVAIILSCEPRYKILNNTHHVPE